ncbi:hypothetical protein AB8886_19210 [Yersinia enterocolitica]|uniref:hypothetical protein n=1 Tax=Yersinia enterocolitica TaxID=630 RepID=UPI0021E8C17C|nr:hypothetical protein [Yersinia enterocolitica]UYJ99106.1 hypothetical protein N4W06_08660 [Yersinia enterocolitica]
MSKIERYAGNLRAFGSNAQGLERTLFGETTQGDDLTSQITNSFLRGWGIVGPSENPSMEDFNAAMYTMSQFIAYQHQMGIPEWDDLQEYYSGSICVRNGEAYLSLVDSNIGSAPPSSKWTSVLTAKNALANISGFLKSTNNLSDLPDKAVSRTNLELGNAAQRTIGTASANVPDIAIADARYKPIDYTPVLSRVWVSNEYMPVTGTPTIVNHGLTGIDVLHCKADVLLKCIATDLAGYSPGDFAAGWGIHYNNAPLSPIPALSSSTITISSGNAGTGILVSGKGGGPSYAIDTTKWRFIFRIFY